MNKGSEGDRRNDLPIQITELLSAYVRDGMLMSPRNPYIEAIALNAMVLGVEP